MKTLLLFLMPVLFLFLQGAPPLSANADTLRYAVAPDANVWFYASESEEDKLFLLPETYYVRVLAEGETYSAVEYLVNEHPYKKLVGYCRTDALKFVSFIPARPFLKKQITLSYTLPDIGGNLSGAFGSIEKTFVYYGVRYENGGLYLYVYDGTSFGYVPAAEQPDFERNDDWLYVPDEPVIGTDDPPTSEQPSALTIVLSCLVAGAAVTVAVFVLRGKRNTPPQESERDL